MPERPSPPGALLAVLADEERLEERAAKPKLAPLVHALLWALLGRRPEAETAVAEALQAGPRSGAFELATAMVYVEIGWGARAAGALERAEADSSLAASPEHLLLVQAMHARVLLLQDAPADVAEAALATNPSGRPRDRAEVFHLLAAAEVALASGNAAACSERALLASSASSCTGLLAARARLLLARAELLVDPHSARRGLEDAIHRLGKIGAARDLGLAYLSMADVAAADAKEIPAQWLARAQLLLTFAGTARDVGRLRGAFRRHGRREIDRVVDADVATVVDTLRERQARLLDLLSAQRDAREARRVRLPADVLVDRAVESLAESGEEVVRLLERTLVDRERTGQLVAMSREISAIDSSDELVRAIPRLALVLCGADAAAVLEDREGSQVLAFAGMPLETELPRLVFEVREAIASGSPRVIEDGEGAGGPRSEGEMDGAIIGRALVLPFAQGGERIALVVERARKRGRMQRRDLEQLSVFTSLASTALERVRSGQALREAAARDTAVLAAIREGLLAVDPDGRVRSLNDAAAKLLGFRSDELRGRLLKEVPRLAALADAIVRGGSGEVVSMPQGDVLVHSRAYEGGVVATLQELATAQRVAHRLVSPGSRFTFDELVGSDPDFLACLQDARRAARADVPILITGESGTGKEMLAQAIHNASPRASAPFVGINAAAIPRELIESELFGYDRGAFTGARSGGKPGKFELAESGTLLLDEIGDLPAEMQTRLLRVLQERAVQRLGGTRDIPVRARIIATTNKDLEQAVADGSFRLDLYHRLRVVHLRLPPLRHRRGDISALVEHHLRLYCARARREPIRVSARVLEQLERYAWPGNVRELANLLEGVASLLPEGQSELDEVPAAIRRRAVERLATPVASGTFEEFERALFQQTLDRFSGNVTAAARALGLAKGTLYNKIRRYGLAVRTEFKT